MVACKAEMNTPLGVKYRRVIEKEEGSGTTAVRRFTTMACFHCTNPACRAACPVNAISKTSDGIVLISQTACIGCRRCEWACPYGAPQFNPNTGKVEKCTFCKHRIDAGWSSGNVAYVACAAICPGKALKGYVDIGLVSGALEVSGLPSSSLTNPNVKWIETAEQA